MSFGNFGFSEILIIAVLVLIFFGPRRMPEIGRAVGGALREFRRGLNEIQRELQEAERAAKIDPDIVSRAQPGPGAKTGSAATTASEPSTPASQTSDLPTPLAAAMASPSEPSTAMRSEDELASGDDAADEAGDDDEGVTAEAGEDEVAASVGAPEQTDAPIKKEAGPERAG